MKIRPTWRCGAALLLALAPPVLAKAPKLAPDAPYCAPPGARPIFVSPMGEPFRGQAGQPYPSAAWFAGADANRDGKIDRAEFMADASRFFRSIDRDHDGRLTPDEVAAYEHDVAPEIALYSSRPQLGDGETGRGRPGGLVALALGDSPTSGYGGPMGAGRYSWLNVPEPVVSADADVDRLVTEAEFRAAAERRFDALDKDHAGSLRLATLGQTPAQAAIDGPCRPRPKRKHPTRDDPVREPPR